MKNKKIKKLVYSALFIAIGIILPFFTGQIPSIGKMLLPMHLPVILCGFLCGPLYGLIVGIITPLLRSLFFGMPPLFPSSIGMAIELGSYGLISGALYNVLPKKIIFIYLSLIIAMLFGRIIWGVASIILYSLANKSFTWNYFFMSAFINAIPGIILQIIVIPIIVGLYNKKEVAD